MKQDGHSSETITHLSLCSGYEGIGLGLRRVLPNLREIAYVEREGFPVANLVAKMEEGELDAAPVFTDVKSFPYRKFRGLVDILSGGFPCQPFSTAGKREGVDDPRHLFPFIRDGIRECQPGIVFLENVEGIISAKTADGESVLQYVLRELEGLGYRATAGVFSAAEVGAPHQRKRVFILASNVENAPITGTRHLNRETKGQTGRRKGIRQGDGETGPVWTDSAGAELADAQSNRSARKAGTICEEAGQVGELPRELVGSGHRYKELADGNSQRIPQRSVSESVQEEYSTAGDCGLDRWPARPGEPQHDWEEPRVVANTKSQQGSPRDHRGQPRASSQSEESQFGRGHSGSLRESNGQAQSSLGRASHGSSSRVDRLRLLGNGVVPDTAAKAFVTLVQSL